MFGRLRGAAVVTLRVVTLIMITAGVSACANSSVPESSLPAGGLQLSDGAATAAVARQGFPKSVAARVLAAIALERVTGRKTDPARFVAQN